MAAVEVASRALRHGHCAGSLDLHRMTLDTVYIPIFDDIYVWRVRIVAYNCIYEYILYIYIYTYLCDLYYIYIYIVYIHMYT